MKREQWPLVALGFAPGYRLSPVQMQKALFLIGKYVRRANEDAFYSFQPYHYGPFDSQVYQDLRTHATEELVQRVDSSQHTAGDFQLTPLGVSKARSLSSALSADEKSYLQKLLRWISSLDFRELVTAIYSEFPDYKVKSVFNE